MGFFIALAIRGGLGLILGILFGIAGLLFTYWVFPGLVPPMWLLVFMVGVFASSAGFLAWLKPEANWRVTTIGLLLAFVGGMAGAWAGFWYGETFYPEGVRNIRFVMTPELRSPAVFAFINGATFGSAGLGGIYYALRLWRYHET